MKNLLLSLSLLLSIPLFAQYNPKEYIAKEIQNLRTKQLKGQVKYTRSIVYNKSGEVEFLEIEIFDEKGNVVQRSYEDWPLSPYGGCLLEIRFYDYDNDGRLTGVFWSERGCFGDVYAYGEYYTVKYDEKGRPVAITWYDQGEYSSKVEDFDIKPKKVFKNLDSKKIIGQITYLYDNQGRLVVSQGSKNKNNSDDRVMYEYDDFGRIIKEIRYWHEYDKDNNDKQHVSKSYYAYNNGTTFKIEDKDSVVEKLYRYDSAFFQIEGQKKLQSASNIVYDFGKWYYKKNEKIIVDSNNPFDVLPLLDAVIDTSMSVWYEKNGRQYDKDGLCIQRIYDEGKSGEHYHWSPTDIIYNTHGSIIEIKGSGHEWCENYQYDDCGNWIQYDWYVNSTHDFFNTYKRTIVYYYNTIGVSASPSGGGTVSGGGKYQRGEYIKVSAVANSGYSFVNWTENGVVVSTKAEYFFEVDGYRTLVANFTYNGGL